MLQYIILIMTIDQKKSQMETGCPLIPIIGNISVQIPIFDIFVSFQILKMYHIIKVVYIIMGLP